MVLLASLLLLPLINPTLGTETVDVDADDPAILYLKENSIIIGTDKEKAPAGGLFAFNLQGKIVAKFQGLDRPNNVDVVQDFVTPNGAIHLAITTERLKNRLRVFKLTPGSTEFFQDVTGDTEVFQSDTGEDKAPMGIATWQDNGKTYAFVTPKAGKSSKHLEQSELVWNPVSKKIDLKLVRRFGAFSGKKETESIVVDAKTRRVYYSDELVGVWCYDADPSSADKPIGLIKNPEHTGDHEGLAIWDSPYGQSGRANGTGLLVSTDQRKDETVYWFYDRISRIPRGGFRAPVDETDGIEILAKPMGTQFPAGIMVTMNSKGKNFMIFDLQSIRPTIGIPSN